MLEARLVKQMSAVTAYRERLASLQGSWDTLSLLSHLSGSGAEMGNTRQSFEALAADLLNSLAAETFKKAVLALRAKAQIAVDIIVRNLYERTADIGFLCADDDLKRFVRERQSMLASGADAADLNATLHRRLREYVAKYSVYRDVIVLDTEGRVLLQLDQSHRLERSADPLIAQTLSSRAAYVETFRATDLASGGGRSLIYSYRIDSADRALGVLCLSFKLDDEVASIFSQLREQQEWAVLAFLDADAKVIASSDECQLPLGAAMTMALDERGKVVRFAGRQYLAVTRPTHGYQGYVGPGWYGHAMLPLEHAFEAEDETASSIDAAVLSALRASEAIFSRDMRDIPRQASTIQRELSRSVWNGNIHLPARSDSSGDFAKVLLREIGNTGLRTQQTFERSIGELHETVISAIMQDAQQFALLAVDILDRNLYERANDCRWWALNGTLRDALSGERAACDQLPSVLQHINSLYTVYHGLVVFDASRGVVAVSNSRHASLVGKQLQEEWAGQTLSLRDSQSYCVSEFQNSPLYENRPTLVFGAAIRNEAGRMLGGIGIVFDSQPQLHAMLQDAMPRTESGEVVAGSIGVFIDAQRRVLAATSRYKVGDELSLPPSVFSNEAQGRAQLIDLDGHYYAVGCCKSSGYREYRGKGAAALIMIRLGPVVAAAKTRRATQSNAASSRGLLSEAAVDVATFHCNDQWLGITRDRIVAAIDGSGLRAMPGQPHWHAGVLVHEGNAIIVIDVARLLGSRTRSESKEVIVVHCNGKHAGLLVDELADIPEIAANRLMPVADVLLGQAQGIVGRAVKPIDPQDPVLFILDLERLLLQINSRAA